MDATAERDLDRAAAALGAADALVIGAGAGMGVDSGLPDFRGPQGFWRAYPPYVRLGLGFTDLANPEWFASDPAFAWGFYGHRRNLYRATRPHDGFGILLRRAGRMPRGYFVVTSNVDGHFQRAGFDPARVVEIHGSIDWSQCTGPCADAIFPAEPGAVAIDEATMRAAGPLPSCPRCGALARPNILMFGDPDWNPARFAEQHDRLLAWQRTLAGAKVVVLEFGAGLAVPSIRRFCEQAVTPGRGTLVRVNPREPEVTPGHIGLPLGALEAIRALDARWASARP